MIKVYEAPPTTPYLKIPGIEYGTRVCKDGTGVTYFDIFYNKRVWGAIHHPLYEGEEVKMRFRKKLAAYGFIIFPTTSPPHEPEEYCLFDTFDDAVQGMYNWNFYRAL